MDNPAEGESTVDLGHLYRLRFPERQRQRRRAVWKVLVKSFFERWIEPSDTVLDIGCGRGEFIEQVEARRKIGVDFNHELAEVLDPSIEFHSQPAWDLSFLPDDSVDVVFSSNLLEHLSKPQVERVVSEARRVLRPSGQLMLLGPNARAIPGDYWDFWDHRTPITDRSLTELLGVSGFRVDQVVSRFLPYTTRTWLPMVGSLVELYLRVPLAWPLLGAQFFIRASVSAGWRASVSER